MSQQEGDREPVMIVVSSRVKVTLRIIRSYPSTVVLPLLVLAILVSLETGGMHVFHKQLVVGRQVRSQSLANSIAAALQLQVLVFMKPLDCMVELIRQVPQWPQLSKLVQPFSDGIVDKDAHGTPTSALAVLPQGIFAGGSSNNMAYFWGHDVLADDNHTLNPKTIHDDSIYFFPLQGVGAFAVMRPVFIDGTEPNTTFGYPRSDTKCSECCDPVQKRCLWGFVAAYVDMISCLKPRQKGLRKLHKYSILAPLEGNIPQVGLPNITENARLRTVGNTSYMILDSSSHPADPSKAIKTCVNLTSTYCWELLTESSDRDINILTSSVLAGMVFATIVLCCVLFITLVSRCKLQLLLECLVPEPIIEKARKDPEFLVGSKPMLTVCSTADLMMRVATDIASGKLPRISDALALRSAVLQRWDLYTPIDLQKQLLQGHLDPDVTQALLHQLLGVPENQPETRRLQGDRSVSASLEEVNVEAGCPRKPFHVLYAGLDGLMSGVFPCSTGDSVALSSDYPERVLLERAERVLTDALSSWNFNAFELAEATNGFPLSTLGFYIMHHQGLIDKLKLDPANLLRFLHAIEGGYRSCNAYHNSTHAADVLQSIHVILTRGGLVSGGYADDLMLLAAYLAAIIHDYDHSGVTNDFLIHTQDDLACRYNDKSPLENHHVAAAWALLKDPSMNFLPSLSNSKITILRKAVIELVLATDMKQHFCTITHFNAITFGSSVAASTESSSGGPKLTQPDTSTANSSTGMSESKRLSVLQMALKCADLAHTAADLPVHKRWLAHLEEEFFKQGDRERELGLPISPLFDRSKPGVCKSQVGFYNVVVLPMYTAFCNAFPDCSPLLEGAEANAMHWQKAHCHPVAEP